MLSAVARIAIRKLNAPAQQVATTSRNAYSLSLILSGQRFYTATASEAAEHPDPSSAATTTTTRSRKSRLEHAATDIMKDSKAKEQAKAEMEKLRVKAAAEKAKAKKEKMKQMADAAKEKKEKAKARQVTKAQNEKAKKERMRQRLEAAREKAKTKKMAETEKAKKEKEKLKAPQLKEEAEIATAVSHILVLPKALPVRGFSLYFQEKGKGAKSSSADTQNSLTEAAKSWVNEDPATKSPYEARAVANKALNKASLNEFILAHKPIEIYNHNRAIRQLKAKGVKRITLSRVYKLPSEAKLTEIDDPRVPKKQASKAYSLFVKEEMHSGDGPMTERFKKAAQDWKTLSEEEKNSWQARSDAQRNEVWVPAMMEAFGTILPSKLPFRNKSAVSSESAPSTAA